MRTLSVFLLAMTLQITIPSEAAEIIFKDAAGRVLSKDDLKNASGKFEWEIRSGKAVPDQAKELHQLGRKAGERGDKKSALALFEKSAKIAPEWAYPIYDAAYTHLLMGDFSEALVLYKRVNDLSPRGFFTAQTALYALQGEAKGDFPKGTYLYFLSIEWTDDADKKAQIVDQLLAKVPKFAPAWKAKAWLDSSDNDAKRLGYLDNGLKCAPDPETKGFLLINKALILDRQNRKSEAIAILGELALNPSSPLDIEAIAKKTLATLASK
jgi:tetratricopeptide (TPR) repeat protein